MGPWPFSAWSMWCPENLPVHILCLRVYGKLCAEHAIFHVPAIPSAFLV